MTCSPGGARDLSVLPSVSEPAPALLERHSHLPASQVALLQPLDQIPILPSSGPTQGVPASTSLPLHLKPPLTCWTERGNCFLNEHSASLPGTHKPMTPDSNCFKVCLLAAHQLTVLGFKSPLQHSRCHFGQIPYPFSVPHFLIC